MKKKSTITLYLLMALAIGAMVVPTVIVLSVVGGCALAAFGWWLG